MLLERQEEDGLLVEPKCYVPVIPTLLLNGCSGIGTGWSSFVPAHRPTLLVDYVESLVRAGSSGGAQGRSGHFMTTEAEMGQLRPWVLGFRGQVQGEAPNFNLQGLVQRTSKTTVEITELPAGRWTTDYKEHLFRMIERGFIKKFAEHHTTENVCFIVTAREKSIDKMTEMKGGLGRAFVLDRAMTLTNMHAFDSAGKIKKYESAGEIMLEHLGVRHDMYVRRRALLMQRAAYEEAVSRNRASFIAKLGSGELDVLRTGPGAGRSKLEVASAMRAAGLASHEELYQLAGSEDLTAGGAVDKISGNGFDYLLDMPFQSLTAERAQDLHRRSERARDALQDITRASPADLWVRDLDALRPVLAKREKDRGAQ